MRGKRIKVKIAPAALLLVLLASCGDAFGQSDGFFNNAGGARDGNYNGVDWNGLIGGGNGGYWNNIYGGNDGGSWNDINGGGDGASWNGMEDETPLGGGLLILAASGVCYAAARVKRVKSKD